ncbi:type II secretion system F family protein, partial [Candidatus Uhrbacteria bacterium]|nr:type II secretion system F family protein [Candidatus Uhrbacteria bacterium]
MPTEPSTGEEKPTKEAAELRIPKPEDISTEKEGSTEEERQLENYEREQKKKGTRTRPAWWIKKKRQKVVLDGKGSRFLFLGSKDKVVFAKHLAVMLDAGIPLKEGLEAMRDQTPSRALRIVLGTAVKDLSDGQVLAHTFAKFPRLFDAFFSNVVGVGEASGTLAKSLLYLATQLEKSRELQSKLRTALIYPIIIFVAAIGIAV